MKTNHRECDYEQIKKMGALTDGIAGTAGTVVRPIE